MNNHINKPASAFSHYGYLISLGMIIVSMLAGQLFLLRGWWRMLHFLMILHILYLFYKLHYSEDKGWEKLALNSSLITKECSICKRMKPARFYHCRTCNRCRFRMDHHCDWINNCIFASNLKLYVQLLVLTFILSSVTLGLLLMKIPKIIRMQSSILLSLLGGCLAILAVLVMFETYRLVSDQYEALK
jgi:hypothetical protein